jgi:hypothetical protein
VASQRAFAACFDASLALIGAHEAEGEASDDGHVFGPVSCRDVVMIGGPTIRPGTRYTLRAPIALL